MFVLQISATPPAVEQIKAKLWKALPDVKASHRVEALGRGLGFRTYAALRAASCQSPSIVSTSGEAFANYLLDHGFSADPACLHRAAATVAIQNVLERTPRLSARGIGFGQPRRNEDRSWQTPQQKYAEFMEEREECLTPAAADQFLLSLSLLSRIPRTKTVRSGTGSYRLKHIAENYACAFPEGGKLGPRYVSNGMFIAAAIHAGFKLKTYVDHLGYDLPNANFNMSKTAIDDLDAEMRPNTGFAQGRARTAELRRQMAYFADIKRGLAAS